jgi:hypothetical protein
MRPLGTMLVAAGMACAAVAVHRAAFRRSRPSSEPCDTLAPCDGACGVVAANKAPQLLTYHQTDESVRWHLSRAEAKRIRRAYRRMRCDIDSRLDNPAWPHPSTGRSA